ncbi:MAG TPA: nuclear transport factor 2 family protein [Thermoanaerobaculia bacterium]|nr:nuclear transport factor 2 family protein [Thermoanaerobaculia bacterium]
MRPMLACAAAAVLLWTAPALAQEPENAPPAAPAAAAPSPEALHDQIRAIRDEILAAIAKNDFDAIVPHLHPNVVFTPMNNEICRGPEEVRAYFDRMLKGPDAVLKSVRFDMKVDRLTDIYGDTGLAFGDSDAVYVMNNGMELPVHTRWTCALVRHEGRWKIAAFQASPDAFDNPILEQSKKGAALKAGGIAAVAGLLLGFVVGRRRKA